jgi:hypothetical protein
MINEKKKSSPKKNNSITKTKQVIMEKFFGKAPVFGDGLTYQQKLRSK